ncbi:MAG: M28 family peptidase [Bacteroidia bacterium]
MKDFYKGLMLVFLALLTPFFSISQPHIDPKKYKRAEGKDSVAEYYSKSISLENMSRNLHVLASDAYEGRETGKKGQKMAAAYIAQQFKAAGIPTYKDTTYFQSFSLNVILPKPAEVRVEGKKFKNNKDFYTYPEQARQWIETDSVLFLGYGIKDISYNDYKGVNVKGKVVMVLAGEPILKDSTSLITGKKSKSAWTSYGRVKIEEARELGVKALLVVVEDINKDLQTYKHKLESPSMKFQMDPESPFVLYISEKMAGAILGSKKTDTIQGIRKTIAQNKRPWHIMVKRKFSILVQNGVQQVTSENVLGYVEGSDLKEEVVIITAHYDHLGKAGKMVFNGADDDGSGTVAVIEMAKVFAKAKKEGHGPRRSILFMAVSGEEKGLLGSDYYVKNPVFPLKSTVCDLNIDMIGRLDSRHENNPNYVYIIGSDKLSSALHKAGENANKLYTGLELDYTYNDERDKNRYYYRSDHYNFAKRGIPVIFYFCGVHPDYHKETDEVEKIDFKKMTKITQLVFFTAWDVANREDRVVVDSDKK